MRFLRFSMLPWCMFKERSQHSGLNVKNIFLKEKLCVKQLSRHSHTKQSFSASSVLVIQVINTLSLLFYGNTSMSCIGTNKLRMQSLQRNFKRKKNKPPSQLFSCLRFCLFLIVFLLKLFVQMLGFMLLTTVTMCSSGPPNSRRT